MKDKPTDLIERATKAGCETVQDFAMWINGYEEGVDDAVYEFTPSIPKTENAILKYDECMEEEASRQYTEKHKNLNEANSKTFPDHMNAAIAEGEENRRQELKERKERYADYSDQGDEK